MGAIDVIIAKLISDKIQGIQEAKAEKKIMKKILEISENHISFKRSKNESIDEELIRTVNSIATKCK